MKLYNDPTPYENFIRQTLSLPIEPFYEVQESESGCIITSQVSGKIKQVYQDNGYLFIDTNRNNYAIELHDDLRMLTHWYNNSIISVDFEKV